LERLKIFTRLESNRFAGRNVDFGASARISADARLAGFHVKDPKTAQFDAVALGEGLLHGFEDGLHRDFRPSFGDTGASYDLRYDVELNHANLLKTGILIVDMGLFVVKTFLLYYHAGLFPGDGWRFCCWFITIWTPIANEVA
jgi:hypothetical protein